MQNLGSSLSLSDDLKRSIKIQDVINIAEVIVKELSDEIYSVKRRKNGMTRRGALASIVSESNIPYLKVFANHEWEVCIRNGHEVLYSENPRDSKNPGDSENTGNSEKYKYQNGREKISQFPCHYLRNGSYDVGYKEEKTLACVFGNDKSLVANVLSGKYITSINVHLPSNNQHKTIYEINTAETQIPQISKRWELSEEVCENFARDRNKEYCPFI